MKLCTEYNQVWFEGKIEENEKALKALYAIHLSVMGFDCPFTHDDEPDEGRISIGFLFDDEIEENGIIKCTDQEDFKRAWKEIKAEMRAA